MAGWKERAEEELGSEYVGVELEAISCGLGSRRAGSRPVPGEMENPYLPRVFPWASPLRAHLDWEGFGVLALEKLGENAYGEEGR